MQEDPSIRSRYASMENEVRNSANDPYGAYTTPFVREKSQQSQLMNLMKMRSNDLTQSSYDAQQNQFGRQVTAASLTNPQLVQTGGTGTGTTTQTSSGGFFQSILPSVFSGAGTAIA